MAEKDIAFRLLKVATRQFATFDVEFKEKERILLNSNISFGIDQNNKFIACFCDFGFLMNNKPLIKLETQCEFQIKDEAWQLGVNEKEGFIEFPVSFLRHLAMLTVGTSRGILHAKTEGSKFNKFVLPTINVSEIIKSNTKFKLE